MHAQKVCQSAVLLALTLLNCTAQAREPVYQQINLERDQGRIFSTDGTIALGTHEWTQSVTVKKPGRLALLQMQVHSPDFGEPILVELSIIRGSSPNGPVIHKQEKFVIAEQLSEHQIVGWWMLENELMFAEGETFCFRIKAADPGLVVAGNFDPGYRGGKAWRDGEKVSNKVQDDMAFITYMDVQERTGLRDRLPVRNPQPRQTWRGATSMTALGDHLYVIQNSRLHRVNPTDGSSVILGDAGWGVPTAIAALGNHLYVMENNRLHRVNPADGSWVVLGDADWGAPTAVTALGDQR